MAASKEERARQFLPFNALTGYYQMILERQRVPEPKKELSEDETEALSEKLKNLQRHDLVSVTYYDKDAYITKTGLITDIDLTFQTLTVVKTKIAFQDIFDVETRKDFVKITNVGARMPIVVRSAKTSSGDVYTNAVSKKDQCPTDQRHTSGLR